MGREGGFIVDYCAIFVLKIGEITLVNFLKGYLTGIFTPGP